MAKSTLQIHIEYGLVRALFALIGSLPVRAALGVARAIGLFAWLIDQRHRVVAMDNLAHAYGPALSLTARRRLVRKVYQHFAMVLAEVMIFPRLLRRETFHRYLRLYEHPETARLRRAGRAVIYVSAHMGNWEVFGAALAAIGIRFHSVVRPLDNPLLDRELSRRRAWFGQTLSPKEGALRSLARALQNGETVVLLVDQAAGSDGAQVEFFGRKCSTQKSVALLALRYDVPIIPSYTWRHGMRFFHTTILDEPLSWERGGSREEEALRVTQAYTSRLEQYIRRHPEQWLWLHRRWKR
ncbi:MAG: lysophospholipid acyltransferase family protein [Planctomycetes bacterium]|nr:lysophospholipid acyltransferase family protein [Planctomycetota bacterium]